MNRDKLWEMMDNKIPNYLLNTIKCIYRNTKIRIKFNDGISEPVHINKGVRQGCGLSPVLFNMYFNKIIQEFKTVIKKGIQLTNRKLVNTILYADDQILMATSLALALAFIQPNQSYSDSRHVKYVISIKCNNFIIL